MRYGRICSEVMLCSVQEFGTTHMDFNLLITYCDTDIVVCRNDIVRVYN